MAAAACLAPGGHLTLEAQDSLDYPQWLARPDLAAPEFS
jgi:16S rRNA G1207 methylase RsmC